LEDRNYYDVEIEDYINTSDISKKKEKQKFMPKQHDLHRRNNGEAANKKQKI